MRINAKKERLVIMNPKAWNNELMPKVAAIFGVVIGLVLGWFYIDIVPGSLHVVGLMAGFSLCFAAVLYTGIRMFYEVSYPYIFRRILLTPRGGIIAQVIRCKLVERDGRKETAEYEVLGTNEIIKMTSDLQKIPVIGQKFPTADVFQVVPGHTVPCEYNLTGDKGETIEKIQETVRVNLQDTEATELELKADQQEFLAKLARRQDKDEVFKTYTLYCAIITAAGIVMNLVMPIIKGYACG